MSTWCPAAVGPGGKVGALGPDDGAFALALAPVARGSTAAAPGGPTVVSRDAPAAPPVERAGLALALLVRSTRWRLGLVGLAAIVVLAAARGAWTPPVAAVALVPPHDAAGAAATLVVGTPASGALLGLLVPPAPAGLLGLGRSSLPARLSSWR